MTKMKLLVLFLFALTFSGLILPSAMAAPAFPKLPNQGVTLTVAVGPDTYPLILVLSDVPNNYDVTNGAYNGWCFSLLETITPFVAINPVTLTSTFTDSKMINYLLNNRDSGTPHDVQAAIWIIQGFSTGDIITNAHFSPSYDFSTANALAGDAESNGGNFVPGPGQIIAVLCVPPGDEQDVLIELRVPFGNGKVTGGGQCITASSTTIPAASFGFNAMWFSRDPTPMGEINYVDHVTGQHVHVHKLTYLTVWFPEPGNKPEPLLKAKFGGFDVYSGLMVDVYVEDWGEPGKNDKFRIDLGGVYLGGSGDITGNTITGVPILAGNIQTHKPPH
jgi:hypothetical protein